MFGSLARDRENVAPPTVQLEQFEQRHRRRSSKLEPLAIRTTDDQNFSNQQAIGQSQQQQQHVSSNPSSATSGFCSSSASSSLSSSHQQQQANGKQSIRSRLLEDLDRLEQIARTAIAKRQLSAPTEPRPSSSVSMAAREFDYSTLCRDEFSSFIQVSSNCSSGAEYRDQRHASPVSGPTLVGVHEAERDDELPPPLDCEAARVDGFFSDEQSSESLECDERPAEQPEDSPQPREHEMRRHAKLSEDKLDVYLQRVESLLKLIAGDRNVGPESVFASERSGNIEVRDELRTQILFEPIKRQEAAEATKVVQDFLIEQTEAKKQAADGDKKQRELLVETKIIESNYRRQLLDSIGQLATSVELNWRQTASQKSAVCDSDYHLIESCLRLQRSRSSQDFSSLKGSFLEAFAADQLKCVGSLERHLAEFLDKLEQRAESPSESWQENWFFLGAGRKRLLASAGPSSAAEDSERLRTRKRAKMSRANQSDTELIEYSRLVRPADELRAGRLAHKLPIQFQAAEEYDEFYRTRENFITELRNNSLGSANQPDACSQLLADEHEALAQELRRPQSGAGGLSIRYATSLTTGLADQLKSIVHHGHLIRLPAMSSRRCARRLADELKSTLLMNIAAASSCSQTSKREPAHSADQVRFRVDLSSVEVRSRLPRVQFCAKISGALPIKVSWFKQTPPQTSRAGEWLELSRVSTSARERDSALDDWPVGMRADFSYELETSWRSRLSFKRHRDEILFEILDGNPELDYNQRYKCRIENYCSSDECQFELRLRPAASSERESAPVHRPAARAEPASSRQSGGESSRGAILRTWSQRTLNRPTGSEPKEEEPKFEGSAGLRVQLANGANGQLGAEFPYHPANLLKRLELNKSSLTLRRKFNYAPPAVDFVALDGALKEPQLKMEPRDSQPPPPPLDRQQTQAKGQSDDIPMDWIQPPNKVADGLCDRRRESDGAEPQPKPRLRQSRISANNNNASDHVDRRVSPNQSSAQDAANRSISPTTGNPNERQLAAAARVKSLISRFNGGERDSAAANN